jgi:exosortase
MTTTPATNLNPPRRDAPFLGVSGRVWVVVLGLLFVLLFQHFIRRMGLVGMTNGDWSHILVVPFISIYYIYINRERILAQPRRVCLWGLPILIAGIFLFMMGSTFQPLRNDMLQGYSMIIALFGLLLLLLGPRTVMALLFPVVFLGFGVRVSQAFWSIIAGKLQFIAARGAVVMINLFSGLTDMNATVRGSTIDLDYVYQGKAVMTPLNVAEACSGMRMLMAFLALGVALAFLFPRRWWQRVAMIALTLPIAIFVNMLRVAILASMYLIDPSYAQGQFHIFIGMLMLIPAAGLLMLVGWCLEKAVVGEHKPPTPTPIPHKHDTQRFHADWPTVRNGVALGVLLMLCVGLGYLFFLNYETDGLISDSVLAGWPRSADFAGIALTTLGVLAAGVLFFKLVGKPGSDRRWFMSLGVAAGVLLTAGSGLYAVTKATGVVFIKEALPLRYSLTAEFPKQAGNWVMLGQDGRLPTDIEKELGATEYFTRHYLDTTGYEADVETTDEGETIVRLYPDDGSDSRQVRARLSSPDHGHTLVEGALPGEMVTVHIAYYTAIVDSVPHVPDKCWIVAGGTMAFRDTRAISLEGERYRSDPDGNGLLADSTLGGEVRIPGDEVEMVVFGADDASGRRNTAAYFFIANGDIMASNHAVRFSFSLRDRYAYYCKVEMRFPGIDNPEELQARAEAFLRDMMPEIMACLPDWTEVQAGRYPSGSTPAQP